MIVAEVEEEIQTIRWVLGPLFSGPRSLNVHLPLEVDEEAGEHEGQPRNHRQDGPEAVLGVAEEDAGDDEGECSRSEEPLRRFVGIVPRGCRNRCCCVEQRIREFHAEPFLLRAKNDNADQSVRAGHDRQCCGDCSKKRTISKNYEAYLRLMVYRLGRMVGLFKSVKITSRLPSGHA